MNPEQKTPQGSEKPKEMTYPGKQKVRESYEKPMEAAHPEQAAAGYQKVMGGTYRDQETRQDYGGRVERPYPEDKTSESYKEPKKVAYPEQSPAGYETPVEGIDLVVRLLTAILTEVKDKVALQPPPLDSAATKAIGTYENIRGALAHEPAGATTRDFAAVVQDSATQASVTRSPGAQTVVTQDPAKSAYE